MKTILIVDDDKIISNIYKTRFRQEGFTAEVASDGEAAIAALQVVKPDLILLDLMLPKLSGLEVLKRLRQMEVFKSTPVIVLSNSYLTSMIQDAWKAGATKCLSKVDSNPKQVSAIVQDLLRAQSPASGSETQFFARGNQAPQITNDEGDRAFMAQLLQDFNSDAPKQIVAMRQIWGSFPKLEFDQERTSHLADLGRKLHSFSGNAAMSNAHGIARMAAVLEALAKEMHDKPASITPSTIRTVAQTLDFLGTLIGNPASNNLAPTDRPSILVVDDEAISRRAVVYAVEKGGLKCINVDDPAAALHLLETNSFDLVITDVDMPGMDGFAFCASLRKLPNYKTTPVIFVTALTDLDHRAKSALSGGNDFIAKPFLFLELTTKALTFVLKRQLTATPH